MSETSEENEYIRILLPIVKQILSEEMAQKTFLIIMKIALQFLYDGRKAQKTKFLMKWVSFVTA